MIFFFAECAIVLNFGVLPAPEKSAPKNVTPHANRVHAHPHEHVEERERESRKVRLMRDIRAAGKLAHEFDYGVRDYENRGRNGNDEPHENPRARENHGIREKNSVYCAARTDKRHQIRVRIHSLRNHVGAERVIHPDGKKPGQNADDEIHHHEFLRAERPLDLHSEKKKAEHIEEQMLDVPVHEHVRKRLPETLMKNEPYDIYRKIILADGNQIRKIEEEINNRVYRDYRKRRVFERIPERSSNPRKNLRSHASPTLKPLNLPGT